MTDPQPLPSVDVWSAHLEDCLAPDTLAACARLMSPAESQRAMRFHFQRDRERHVVSRAVLRTVLASKLGERPEQLQFDTGPHGKPHLKHDSALGRRLSFSLSHADDLIVLAVTLDHAVGIDVESTKRHAPLDVVRRNFAAVEIQAFDALTDLPRHVDLQTDLFWSCWTLKESLIKATGEGLHAPLNRFGFSFDAEERVHLHARPDTAEGAQRWWFGQWAPSEHHLGALCVAWPAHDARQDARPPRIRMHRFVPLQGDIDVPLTMLRSTTGRDAR